MDCREVERGVSVPCTSQEQHLFSQRSLAPLRGLFFGAVFHRTGNLWMVGIFHGLGDWFTGGLGSLFV